MGMFDYVVYEDTCQCGSKVTGFQSKSRLDDDDCQLETLQPGQVRDFHACCDACGAWHNYEVTWKKDGTGVEIVRETERIVAEEAKS
jgi:hypothetical protein